MTTQLDLGMSGIGVDVGGTTTKGAVVSSVGEVIAATERPTDPSAGTKGILAVVETLLAQASSDGVEIGSIGVGAAGFIDAKRGAVTFSPNLVYDDPEIAAAIRARADMNVVVDNDANAAAWGEYRVGGARGTPDLAFITLGTGVGSGFVVGGRLVRGARGAGAELGHMVIDPSGPQCPCGLRGCLEQFASGSAIERLADSALQGHEQTLIRDLVHPRRGVRGEDVARAAREYDEVARRILRQAGTSLGIALSNVVNIFDPHVIVLGGSVVSAGEDYLGPARDRLTAMLAAQKRPPVRLDVSELGNRAGMIGAALLAMDQLEAA